MGVTWPFVVRKALRQTSFDAALECIVEAPLAGAHNFMLLDAEGNGASVEATPTKQHVEYLESETLVHTNHCLAPETAAVEAERPCVPRGVVECPHRAGIRTSRGGAAHDRPAQVAVFRRAFDLSSSRPRVRLRERRGSDHEARTGDFWACWGPPSENEYERFSLTNKRKV